MTAKGMRKEKGTLRATVLAMCAVFSAGVSPFLFSSFLPPKR
jgi:hypothetical protein